MYVTHTGFPHHSHTRSKATPAASFSLPFSPCANLWSLPLFPQSWPIRCSTAISKTRSRGSPGRTVGFSLAKHTRAMHSIAPPLPQKYPVRRLGTGQSGLVVHVTIYRQWYTGVVDGKWQIGKRNKIIF